MMIKSAAVFGAALGTWIGVSLIPAALERDFIAVRELSYQNGMVTFDRAVVPPLARAQAQDYYVIADWSVHVYPYGERSICNGSGSDVYEIKEPATKIMHIDTFVGQSGCLERLVSGDYTVVATWSPRDGRDTITATFQAIIP